MLKTGAEHLESLRDGRAVFVGGERVKDVTTHPAFRNGAQSIADIYDMKAASENRDLLTYEENGKRYSGYFLQARSKEDLAFRYGVHRAIADKTYGMFGRSPDHVSSFVTGMSLAPNVFGKYADNLTGYYEHMRNNDVYAVYAVIPPQAGRNPEPYKNLNIPVPTLRVVREDDDGVVISGQKMLATGAVYANEIWIGNITPLAPDQAEQSITCAIPCNAPGLEMWSRKPMGREAKSDFESPLGNRYDESDSMLLCNEVKVPWEKVFVHNDSALARQIYVETAGHTYGNHQSNVRFHSKLELIVGLASKVAKASGADQIPAVRETLGKLAAWEAMLQGAILGQIQGAEQWPSQSHWCFNRRVVYAALNWCTENHSIIIDQLRELCGGSVFQMPADISVMADPVLRASFEKYWTTPQNAAVDRMKLYKLAWDLTGSEFAGRHQQYEKFYAGASFVVRNYNFMHTDWSAMEGVAERLLSSYGVPSEYSNAEAA
ncbi:4-hydroxyphenylacetate 3-monooxygenase [Variovorax boronicumulans]|uniref:4-hydroxyphenylacetate 3-monooxygenase n=1 Tax=Variovorax boronicumulans TaxID=436515 RepID=A0AAW8D198_9BURK|nr:4-hydroxyphenylacetate 3-hydroxylase N-terminal domain-containing protein [Variovorax boronicumulans]MDP9894975.1 4-hydroxyphenylacetate 3-monooxygenase [Variovorax boronicumulans]MDQ0038468.1 4-hydroxyphenylacetate 3-monooxygenase [Variovorax boronicumulans]MDQ0044632.1 4-hydroxyphenylacetate 3-monooxygenase [Variovorax boronicumulans]MDQ0054705.1 4-hydroxyphenylacetate 3-monooxygenase [Variovorax boronicumulans]